MVRQNLLLGIEIAVILLSMTLPAASAQAPDAAGQAEYARGVELQQRGDLPGARDAYLAALKLSPRRVDALSNLGLLYGQLGQYDLAIGSFQRALAVDPNQPVVHFNLGLTCLQAQRFEKARSEFNAVLIAQPENTAARHLLGLADLKLGQIKEGITELERVRQAQPRDIELACTLASAYIKLKQLKPAGDLVENALAGSETAEAHFVSGSYYLAAGNPRKSLEHLQRAHEINSNLPDLEATLADAYALSGNQDLAAQMFEKELRANPLDYTANAFLGWLYLEARDLDKATTYLTRARQIHPDDPDLLFQFARLARLQDRQKDAAVLLEQVVAAKPKYVPAHVLLAQVYIKLKRLEDASRERSIVKQLNSEQQSMQPGVQER
jgi:tetratricopeptide (TPR) repeat protein